MNPEELRRWAECKERIASCHECLNHWSPRIEAPIGTKEVPNPKPPISILFVGVAPPPHGKDEDEDVGHFYSNPCDRLRVGLFHVIDRTYKTNLTKQNRDSREAGTTAFLDAGFFFLHAAKVRPCRGHSAPTVRIIRFCARLHLVEEICLLKPHGVCFLGTSYAAPAAEAIFGFPLGDDPKEVEIACADQKEGWRGLAVATVQPVRGTKEGRNRERTSKVIEGLRSGLANWKQ